MKRKSQLLALLMALCLLASLAVVPAAAESLSELESAVSTAQTELNAAQTALNSAKQELANLENSVKDLERKAQEAASKVTDKQSALDLLKQQAEAETDETKKEELNGQISVAETELGNLTTDANSAQSDFETARDSATADIATKKSAVESAKATVTQKQQALNAAQAALKAEKDKQEAEADKPTHPTSSDLSYPREVNFGALEKNASSSSRTRSFTVRNDSKFDMSFSVSTASGYSITAPSTISAGSAATITVELNSSNGVGTYNRTLSMSVSFAGGDGQSYSFSVPLYAEVVEKGYSIVADPTSKDLGKLKEGYSEREAGEKEVTVTIQNKGATSVRMDGVKGNDHFVVTAVKSEYETLKNGEKVDYKIVPKQNLAVGTYTDTITFLTRENTTATFKATVVIEKKLAPLTVEPETLDFGVVEEGYAALAQKTVTVKNNTEYAIRLDQPTSFSYEISLLSQTSLPAGGSATFSIRPRTGMPANLYNGVVELYGSGESAKLNVQFAVTKPAGPSTFSDVAAGSTFAADIAYVSQKGLMSGVGGGRFNPGAPVTRGQLVTILYRLEGQPAVSGVGFPDVAAGSYCEKAVKWAAANGITAGGKDGLFRPGDSITREQLATFLFRYNNYKGYVTTQRADLGKFSDGASAASYAKDALSWANACSLVNGTTDGRLNPSGGATRGQAAAILHRFCVSIGK